MQTKQKMKKINYLIKKRELVWTIYNNSKNKVKAKKYIVNQKSRCEEHKK